MPWKTVMASQFKFATVLDAVPPSSPTNLTATTISTSQINLSWTASTDNVGVTGYRIERCQGASCSNFSEITPSTLTSYSDTGLTSATSYSYRVRAIDAAGNYSGYSTTATAITQVVPDTTAPSTPTNLIATVISSTQINLSWTASTDNVGVTGYRLERCQGVGCSSFSQINTPSSTTYLDTGLTQSTSYSYRVRATDGAGNLSGYSATATGQTTAAAGTGYPMPSILDEKNTYTSWGWSWNANQEPANIVDPFGGTYAVVDPDVHGDTEGDDAWTYLQMKQRGGAAFYSTRANAWLNYYRSGNYRTGADDSGGRGYSTYDVGSFGGDHTYGWGLLLDYEVNGNAASLAEAELIAAVVENLWGVTSPYACVPAYGCLQYGIRLIGRQLHLISRVYEITLALRGSGGTNVARWLTLLTTIKSMVLTSVFWDDTYGMFFVNSADTNAAWADVGANEYVTHGLRLVSGFQIGILAEGMFHAWRVTGDAALRTRLIRMADFVMANGIDAQYGYSGVSYGVRDGKPAHYNTRFGVVGSKIKVRSDGADTRSVTVYGTDATDAAISEVVVLNGTSDVETVATFYRYWKATTTASGSRTITFRKSSDSTQLKQDGGATFFTIPIGATSATSVTGWNPQYTTAHVNLLVMAYKFTGTTAYLTRAKEFFNNGTKGIYGTIIHDVADNVVSHFVDTRFASATGFFYIYDNKGELHFTYMIFENGGSPSIIGGSPDTTPPTIAITAPTNGATVSGVTSITASASDNVGVVGVQFKLDGVNLGLEDTTPPHSLSWDSGTTTAGAHTLTAVARDAAGNQTTSTGINITVVLADTTPPTVSITAPTAGAIVSGTIAVNATASDNVGVVGVQFKVDGANVGAEDTAAPYSINWNTVTVANASHALTAVARDAAGNSTTSASVSVTVNNAGVTSALATLVASLSAGQWGELTGTNLGDAAIANAMDIGGGMIFQYASNAMWDPTSKQFFFLGGAHAFGPNERFLWYDDATNIWRYEPLPTWACPFALDTSCVHHAYDHNTIDTLTSQSYHRPYNSTAIHRYDIATKVWTNDVTAIPYGIVIAMGVTWFNDLGANGSLMVAGGGGALYRWNKQNAQWSNLAVPNFAAMGSYHNFAKYNPFTQKVLFGGGNGSPAMWEIDSSGTVTQKANAPVNLDIPECVIGVDPVNGKYLVFRRDAAEIWQFRLYNSVADTWTATLSNPITTNSTSATGLCIAHCATYNCTLVLMHTPNSGTARLFVYKGGA